MQKNKSFFKEFREKFLGPICLAIFFIVYITIGLNARTGELAGTSFFAEMGNLNSWMIALLPFVAFMIVARAGGLDFSILPLAGLSTIIAVHMFNTGKEGIIIAFLVAAIIGLVHGIIVNYLKWPSFIVTIGTGTLMVLYSMYNFPQENFQVTISDGGKNLLLWIGIILAAAAFLFNLLSPLGTPMRKRTGMSKNTRVSYTLAYVLSSVIACCIGLLVMAEYGQAQLVQQVVDVKYLIVMMMIGCTVLFDNRFLAIIASIVISALFLMINMYGLSSWLNETNAVLINAILIFAGLIFDVVYKRNFVPSFVSANKDKIDAQEKSELMQEAQTAASDIKKASNELKKSVDELEKTVDEVEAAKSKAKKEISRNAEISSDILENRD